MPETEAFDLDLYLSLPRVARIALSPDGRRLVADVQQAAPDGKRFIGSLWELGTGDERPPRRLTRSTKGETFAAFLHDGSILFTSARDDNEPKSEIGDGEDERARLWVLPADGGEARVVASPPNGLSVVHAARDADTVAYLSGRWPGVDNAESDAKRTKTRKDKGVNAQLFDRYPIRFWDHYLASARPRLFVGTAPDANATDGPLADVRDLTPDAVAALEDRDTTDFDVAADGSIIVSTWLRYPGKGKVKIDLVAIDVSSGDRRVIATGEHDMLMSPKISPDGRTVVAVRETEGLPDRAAYRLMLWLIDLATGEGRYLAVDFDNWPANPVWTADGAAVLFTADEAGNTPIFRAEAKGDRFGEVTRLAARGCYSDLCVAPDGSAVYALVSSIASAPEIVRLDPATPNQTPHVLPTPGIPLPIVPPGRVESITATAPDGAPIQSWLVMPPAASPESPAPLVVCIHGGPFSAWGAWHWRWNPQLLAERGYAVVLPNPALSTGFGQDFIQRGWGRWGQEAYADILAAVDDACSRPDVDDSRVAAMGGSFGGYMANWIAGHTDRFRCLVTHASLWSLPQFHGSSDEGIVVEEELGDLYVDPTRWVDNSPHLSVANIRTPLLVIHGERDHRVPISEALSLWTDLARHDANARFLYFPDENHWILKPNNAHVWYEVVFAFLAEHLLDDPAAWKSDYLENLGLIPDSPS